MSSTPAEPAAQISDAAGRTPWRAIALLVAGAFFMENLDGTVIATALPQMGRAFHVSAVALNIGITAYLLSLAVFIPISGWVADRFGARTVFGAAICVFTLASLLCGLSQGMWSFTAARLLQGLGGAAMVPVGRLIVLRMTEKRHLLQALGTIVWPGLAAPVLGPPLGGFLVIHASWRWIFYVNIPLGLAALVATALLIPNSRAEGPPRPLDAVGFLLSGAALTLLVYGIDALGNGHGDPWPLLGLIALGLGLGYAGVRHFARHPTPLLDLSALRVPTYAVGVWGGSLLRMAINSLPFLLPLMFQLGFGLDALTSGGLVLFVFAGNLTMKAFTTVILKRFGFRTVMTGNGVLAALAIAACAGLTPHTPYLIVAVVLFLGGMFRSLQFTAINSIQFVDVEPAQLTAANTLASMLQQLMLGLGVVMGAVSLNASIALRGGVGGRPELADFRNAILLVAVVATVGLFDSFRLPRDAGRSVSGRA
jgi:EmrB/QacA subfamily drug resistance transporter